MYLTGISDEAGPALERQIAATRALGWQSLEARNVQVGQDPPVNLHDLSDRAFEEVVEQLAVSRIGVCCFSSAIANWGKRITDPPDASLAEARRAIPRMLRLGTRLVRVMSFAVREDADDQMEAERFRRLRDLTGLFLDAGLQPVHENCMNYGGMGWPFALKLLENVPGLKWVWDTGNPLFNPDRSKPKPWPRQDPWEFYQRVKPWIAHVHVKDVIWDAARNVAVYTWPGEGHAQVRAVLQDLLATGYDGGVSIEPHMTAVFHDPTAKATPADHQYHNYLEYGRRLASLIAELTARSQPTSGAGV
jgi:sugar phosphate isomerase/epimerase